MARDEAFTHLDENGQARMVDVGAKAVTARKAVAEAVLRMSARTFALLKTQALPKGDALATARIAGIMAAKKTSGLIPLCHPLSLDAIEVRFHLNEADSTVRVEAEARTTGKTGVEMEALVGASMAALALYDMCKAVQKDMVLEKVRLLYKSGGQSGEFRAG
jgi:cyclic pyranopterin phosphate synthase